MVGWRVDILPFIFLFTLLFIFETSCVQYLRSENEQPYVVKERSITSETFLHPLKVGVAFPYMFQAHKNLNWLFNGILNHIERPIDFETEVHLKNWRENNSLIITAGSLNPYFNQLQKEGVKLEIGVIHLNDHDCPPKDSTILPERNKFYLNSKFVLRNYYCSFYANYPNVYYLPLGWLTPPDGIILNYLNDDSAVSIYPLSPDKPIDVFYYGLKSQNTTLVQAIFNDYELSTKYEVYWHDFEDLSESQMPNYTLVDVHFSALIDNFIPPGGETHQFYDAISNGVQPLMLGGEFLKLFQYPFQVIPNWRRISWVESYLAKGAQKSKKEQRNILSFWKKYLHELRGLIRNLVDEMIGDA